MRINYKKEMGNITVLKGYKYLQVNVVDLEDERKITRYYGRKAKKYLTIYERGEKLLNVIFKIS